MQMTINGTSGALSEYLVISLWANAYDAVAVTNFNVEFKASTWGTYTTDWTPVTRPSKAPDPISGAAASEMNSVMLSTSLISIVSIVYSLY